MIVSVHVGGSVHESARAYIQHILDHGLAEGSRAIEQGKLGRPDAQIALIQHRLEAMDGALLALADSIDRLETKQSTRTSDN
jgi:hypothetical protein